MTCPLHFTKLLFTVQSESTWSMYRIETNEGMLVSAGGAVIPAGNRWVFADQWAVRDAMHFGTPYGKILRTSGLIIGFRYKPKTLWQY